MTRLFLALRMWFKCGIGLNWTPRTAWEVAGTMIEFRQFCRERGIRRDGGWLIGRMHSREDRND